MTTCATGITLGIEVLEMAPPEPLKKLMFDAVVSEPMVVNIATAPNHVRARAP